MNEFKNDYSNKTTYSGEKPGANEKIVPVVVTPSLANLLNERHSAIKLDTIPIRGHQIPVIFEVHDKSREGTYISTFNMKVKAYLTHSEETECINDDNPDCCRIMSNGVLIPCPHRKCCESCPYPEIREYYRNRYVAPIKVCIDQPVTNEEGEQASRDIEDKSADGNKIHDAQTTEELIVKAIKESKKKDYTIIYTLKKFGYSPSEMTGYLRCSEKSAYRKVKEYKEFVKEVIKNI